MTTNGALPPSSRCTRFDVAAAVSITRRPTPLEPVKDTMSTSGCAISASPATGPVPVTTLTTPAGIPASEQASANIRAVSGVSSLGFSTIALPAAMAGRIFQAAICNG